jgi:hypothetical protein
MTFASMLRDFRIDTLRYSTDSVTIGAELTEVAIRDFTLVFDVTGVENILGVKAADQTVEVTIPLDAEVAFYGLADQYTFTASQGFHIDPQLYKPTCDRSNSYNIPSKDDMDCVLYDGDTEEKITKLDDCKIKSSHVRNNREYYVKYDYEPNDY